MQEKKRGPGRPKLNKSYCNWYLSNPLQERIAEIADQANMSISGLAEALLTKDIRRIEARGLAEIFGEGMGGLGPRRSSTIRT